MCRCGTCGRFTGHWRLDESFCQNKACWKEEEGNIFSPGAKLCDDCVDSMEPPERAVWW